MYLSEIKIRKKSLKRVSKAVLVNAINAKDKTNRIVAQSLFSIIRGCKMVSIILLQNY
jgi:hypothetical protein